jgi:RNA polymerase sigma-70 factor (ECF subfamily)
MFVEDYFGGGAFQVTRSAHRGASFPTMADGSPTNGDLGALLAAAQRGDPEAYRTFLTAAASFARSIARRRIRSEEAVEDVVQDALLTVHRVRHTYEPGRPAEAWLTAIVTRRAIDALRSGGRIAAREVHDAAAYETFADPAAKEGEAGDAAKQLQGMMSGLTPGQKEALDLVKLKEMTLVEASAASGQSVASLKVNIHRALKRLRLGLEKDARE